MSKRVEIEVFPFISPVCSFSLSFFLFLTLPLSLSSVVHGQNGLAVLTTITVPQGLSLPSRDLGLYLDLLLTAVGGFEAAVVGGLCSTDFPTFIILFILYCR